MRGAKKRLAKAMMMVAHPSIYHTIGIILLQTFYKYLNWPYIRMKLT
mgnify:FL=1